MADEKELGGYQIVGRLAVGGMAEVLQARAATTAAKSPGEPDEVVLKRLLPAHRTDGAYIKQFVDEAKLTVRLRHPNIVRTFKCFKAGPDYLMVQELVVGRTLSYVQEALAKAGQHLALPAVLSIVHQLAQALDYVHRVKLGETGYGIVHRDVNPANVLVSLEGVVKLTDFGVAEAEGLMRGEVGALRGTLAYMSPEQVLGLPIDGRSDLFSVGVILWELLANRRLFTAQSEGALSLQVKDARVPVLSSIVPGLPTYAVQLVRKSVQADRRRRFQSAAELVKAVEILAAREGLTLGPSVVKPLMAG